VELFQKEQSGGQEEDKEKYNALILGGTTNVRRA
jgi:hypothetical protein